MEGAVGSLLHQVYNTHQKELEALNAKLKDLQRQIGIFEDVKNGLEEEVRCKTEQNKRLAGENRQLQLQITKLKEKPPDSCKNCESLRRKVESLSTIKETIFKLLAGSENQGQRRLGNVDSITNTIQTLYTQAFDSDNQDEGSNSDRSSTAPSPDSSPQKQTTLNSSPQRLRVLNSRTRSPQNSPNRLRGSGKSKSLQEVRNVGTRLRGGKGDQTSTRGEGPGEAQDEDEEEGYTEATTRDGTKPQKNLRLSRVKRRSRFTEEGQPSSKRFKNIADEISPNKQSNNSKSVSKQGSLKIDPKDSDVEEVEPPVPHKVLAAETCEVPLDTSQVDTSQKGSSSRQKGNVHQLLLPKNALRRKQFQERPDVVIPETVPMEFSEGEEEEGEGKEGVEGEDKDVMCMGSQSQASTAQVTVRHLEMSPPSHSSTPVCSSNSRSKSHIKLNDGKEVSNKKGILLKKNTKEKSEPSRRARQISSTEDSNDEDCGISEPGSPVFDRNHAVKALPIGRGGEVQSPCLFDEDDGVGGARYQSDYDDDSLPPGLINKQQNLPRKPSQRQATRELVQKRRQLQESYQENEGANESTVSNPSPSVLSGKLTSRFADGANSGWLTKNPTSRMQLEGNSDSRSHNVSNDVILIETGQSIGKSQPKVRLRGEEGGTKENSSPVRLTRSKHKKQSQESPRHALNTSAGPGNTSLSKSLKQTTISKTFFQPPKTFLPTAKGFNGGRLPGSGGSQRQLTTEDKELQDLEEAMQRSLQDLKAQPSQYYETYEDPDLTGPQFTSTPCATTNTTKRLEGKRLVSTTSEEDNTSSEMTVFKKPSTPTTPKHRRPSRESEMAARRSPRLSEMRESQDDTIDPTTQSHSPSNSPVQRFTTGERSHNKAEPAGTRRSLDLGLETIPGETLAPASEMMTMMGDHHHANGSLDPDVRLSQLDHSSYPVAAPSEALGEQFLEPVSFLELCAEESENRSQKTQSRSQKDAPSQVRNPVRRVNDLGSDEDDGIELSAKSVVFGPSKVKKASKQGTKDDMKKVPEKRQRSRQTEDTLNDSFDIIPKKPQPDYAYVDVVRKRAEREQLQTYACAECENYYSGMDLSEEELKVRMKACRHKARFIPPGTPENFWTVGFPDTQECEERGYLNKTQHKPSSHRRQRALKQLFKSSKKQESPQSQDPGGVTDLFEGDDTI